MEGRAPGSLVIFLETATPPRVALLADLDGPSIAQCSNVQESTTGDLFRVSLSVWTEQAPLASQGGREPMLAVVGHWHRDTCLESSLVAKVTPHPFALYAVSCAQHFASTAPNHRHK